MIVGQTIGPYQVLAKLGEGGMGEVYRAIDTKLKRDVAVKVLPAALANDPDRLARFQREAEVLASLNHPNIAAIYGLEESRSGGSSDPPIIALILELVDGPTLADRIARGAIPLDEALPIAKQIAEALEAAHEQGIIHRDLKPANIKVRDDGVVKVLDFGLAKAVAQASSPKSQAPGATQSPTITSPALMTGIGVILGTAAYMSPEQAKGREADKRSDIWAFGCVLFEMLAGTRAFDPSTSSGSPRASSRGDGDDVAETLAAVIRGEPNWEALPADVPAPIRTLIARCLVKDRRQRVSEIATAKFVLAELGHLGAAHTSDASSAAAPRPRWRRALPAAAAATLSALIVGTATWFLQPVPAPPVVSRFSFAVPRDHALVNNRRAVAISPDGLQLVYGGQNQLYTRSVSGWETRAIAGTDIQSGQAAWNPVFSPDGASIAWWTRGGIHRIPVNGGVAVHVCPGRALGITWHSSGIVFGGSGGVFRCPPDGGAPEQLARVADDEEADGPQILPDGRAVIFTIAKAARELDRWDNARVVVQSLPSGNQRTLVSGGSDARYLPTGHLLYSVRGIVLAAPFDPVRQELSGSAVPVIDGVRRAQNAESGATHFDVSASGSLLYVPGPAEGTTTDQTIVLAGRDGRLMPLATPAGPYVLARASRDGTRIVLDSDDGKEAIVWFYELAGRSAPRRLTFGGRNRFPIWSPDGRRVAFQSDREGDRAIFVQALDGTGLRRLTTPEKGDEHVPESWSPDGRHLSFAVLKDATYSLWVLSTGDHKVAPFGAVRSRFPIGSTFSPDGRWIAYDSSDGNSASPSSGVFVQPFPATGTIRQAPKVPRDSHVVWSSTGDELFYRDGTTGLLRAVRVTSGMTFGNPQSLPGAVAGSRPLSAPRAFDVLPDGRFVGLVRGSAEDISAAGAPPEIRVVLNWQEELKRLVPRK